MFDVFFFKQKTAYEMRISDWSSDVCSSDLMRRVMCPRQDRERGSAFCMVNMPKEAFLKKFYTLMAVAGLAALGACGGQGDDTAADKVEDQYDAQADALENQADQLAAMGNETDPDQLDQQADTIKDMGDQQDRESVEK